MSLLMMVSAMLLLLYYNFFDAVNQGKTLKGIGDFDQNLIYFF